MMLRRIYDTQPDGSVRHSFIDPAAIEGITTAKNDPGVVKIHMSCGKEFRADLESLTILKDYINLDLL